MNQTAAQPVDLVVTLRYATVEEFEAGFAPCVGREIIFLRTRSPKPVGSALRAELRLKDGFPALVVRGHVMWSCGPDHVPRGRSAGMGLAATPADDQSARRMERMLETHGEGALARRPGSTAWAAALQRYPRAANAIMGTSGELTTTVEALHRDLDDAFKNILGDNSNPSLPPLAGLEDTLRHAGAQGTPIPPLAPPRDPGEPEVPKPPPTWKAVLTAPDLPRPPSSSSVPPPRAVYARPTGVRPPQAALTPTLPPAANLPTMPPAAPVAAPAVAAPAPADPPPPVIAYAPMEDMEPLVVDDVEDLEELSAEMVLAPEPAPPSAADGGEVTQVMDAVPGNAPHFVPAVTLPGGAAAMAWGGTPADAPSAGQDIATGEVPVVDPKPSLQPGTPAPAMWQGAPTLAREPDPIGDGMLADMMTPPPVHPDANDVDEEPALRPGALDDDFQAMATAPRDAPSLPGLQAPEDPPPQAPLMAAPQAPEPQAAPPPPDPPAAALGAPEQQVAPPPPDPPAAALPAPEPQVAPPPPDPPAAAPVAPDSQVAPPPPDPPAAPQAPALHAALPLEDPPTATAQDTAEPAAAPTETTASDATLETPAPPAPASLSEEETAAPTEVMTLDKVTHALAQETPAASSQAPTRGSSAAPVLPPPPERDVRPLPPAATRETSAFRLAVEKAMAAPVTVGRAFLMGGPVTSGISLPEREDVIWPAGRGSRRAQPNAATKPKPESASGSFGVLPPPLKKKTDTAESADPVPPPRAVPRVDDDDAFQPVRSPAPAAPFPEDHVAPRTLPTAAPQAADAEDAFQPIHAAPPPSSSAARTVSAPDAPPSEEGDDDVWQSAPSAQPEAPQAPASPPPGLNAQEAAAFESMPSTDPKRPSEPSPAARKGFALAALLAEPPPPAAAPQVPAADSQALPPPSKAPPETSAPPAQPAEEPRSQLKSEVEAPGQDETGSKPPAAPPPAAPTPTASEPAGKPPEPEPAPAPSTAPAPSSPPAAAAPEETLPVAATPAPTSGETPPVGDAAEAAPAPPPAEETPAVTEPAAPPRPTLRPPAPVRPAMMSTVPVTGNVPLLHTPVEDAETTAVADAAQTAASPRGAAPAGPPALVQGVGIGLPGGRLRRVFATGDAIPARWERGVPGTGKDKLLELELFESPTERVTDGRALGKVTVRPPTRKAVEEWMVTFSVDEDAVLTVQVHPSGHPEHLEEHLYALENTTARGRGRVSRAPKPGGPPSSPGGFMRRLMGR